MKIKLSYKDPDQSVEAIRWLKSAEDRLNHSVRKQLQDFEGFGVTAMYVALPEEKKDGPRS